LRRVGQGVPRSKGVPRGVPGMPPEMADPDDEGSTRPDWEHSGKGRRTSWWRPASTAGRVLLILSALIVLGGVGTGVYFLKTLLQRDSGFRIAGTGNIETTGLTEVSRAEMLPVFGEDIGRNVFFVNLGDRRRHLEEIPWVERATVIRLLPDRIRVQVVERQPVAFVRQGQQIGLVDANGVLLTMAAAAMAEHHYSFPVVTGISPGDSLAGRKARMAMYGHLLSELDAGGQHFSEQISEIDLTDAEDARVSMPEPGADILAHFGNDRFLERYQRYKAHIAEWRQQYPKLSAVDLRYDQQVVLEMSPGTSAVETGTGEQADSSTKSDKDSADAAAGRRQVKPKPGQTADAGPNKTAAAKPGAEVSRVNAGGHPSEPAGNATSKQRTGVAKGKMGKVKKHAEVQRATLNGSKRKPAPTNHPAAAGQGE